MARAQLVEGAIDLLVARLSKLEMTLTVVAVEKGNLPVLDRLTPDRIFVVEQIEPIRTPCVFVIPERSRMLYDEGENITHSEHTVGLTIVVEDTESERLTRKSWRYARAVWMLLHDNSDGTIKVFVDAMEYGHTEMSERSFRKDVTLTLRVLHYEEFF